MGVLGLEYPPANELFAVSRRHSAEGDRAEVGRGGVKAGCAPGREKAKQGWSLQGGGGGWGVKRDRVGGASRVGGLDLRVDGDGACARRGC